MKIKTSELMGAALDWAVAKAEGEPIRLDPMGNMGSRTPRYWIWDDAGPLRKRRYLGIGGEYVPSANWALAGPIIEREGIATREIPPVSGGNGYIFTRRWVAEVFRFPEGPRRAVAYGTTPLVAAMRCYVASRLGDEVEIPDELTPVN